MYSTERDCGNAEIQTKNGTGADDQFCRLVAPSGCTDAGGGTVSDVLRGRQGKAVGRFAVRAGSSTLVCRAVKRNVCGGKMRADGHTISILIL